MRVSELDPNLLRAAGGVLGLLLGLVGTKLADRLPARYDITHLTEGKKRSRRNILIIVLAALCSIGIAHVVVGADVSVAHAVFLVTVNAIIATSVIAAAAIDLEHLILPNELTLGVAVLCVATSPLRSVTLKGSIAGAVLGLLLAYLPFALLKKIRGESTMGLGDAKLAIMAGAWHGMEGAVFVLFLAGVQSAIVAMVMRVSSLRFEMPDSVKAELAELRARAAAGDEEAKSDLADDPLAVEREDALGMRLPFGPFLALGCIEVLFLRRWLMDQVVAGWLMR
jgi:leader peptidase (prepilin peptidase)/N-methyltransferase